MGPFIVRNLHGKNAVEVILTGEYKRKHPVFPVSLIKHYEENEKNKFPLRQTEEELPAIDNSTDKVVWKILKQRIMKEDNKEIRQYLIRYKNRPADEDEWLNEPDINKDLLRTYRREKRS